MKLNNKLSLHKIKKEFDPNSHWYQLLILVFVLLILIIAYSIYNLFYIKNQINELKVEAQNQIANATSTDFLEKTKRNNKLMKDINNLSKNLERYKLKEDEFNRLLNLKVAPQDKSTTTATTTVATSSKQ